MMNIRNSVNDSLGWKRGKLPLPVLLSLIVLLAGQFACRALAGDPVQPAPLQQDPGQNTTDIGSSTSTYSLTVKNESTSSICYLYISPDTSDEWGPDQLGSDNVLQTGESFEVFGIDPGLYDLRVVTCDDEEVIRSDVQISEDLSWTITD